MKKVMLCNAYVTKQSDSNFTIPKGSVVTVKEQYSGDSLVSHPDCEGFFMWNKDLADLEV